MSATEMFERCFGQCPLVAIIRGVTPDEVDAIGGALVEGGIRIIEVPLNSPEPLASIERLAGRFGNEVLVGAGTVLKPDQVAQVRDAGGRLVVCEFSTPVNGAFRTVYMEYLMKALPAVARAVSSNPDAYVYLAESIRAWPTQDQLAQRIADAGWTKVRWRNLTGGIVALHHAVSPS